MTFSTTESSLLTLRAVTDGRVSIARVRAVQDALFFSMLHSEEGDRAPTGWSLTVDALLHCALNERGLCLSELDEKSFAQILWGALPATLPPEVDAHEAVVALRAFFVHLTKRFDAQFASCLRHLGVRAGVRLDRARRLAPIAAA